MSHRSKVQTATYLYLHSNNHRWLAHGVQQYSFLFVSRHSCNSEVSANRPSEQRVSFFWCNMIVIYHNTSEILSNFNMWIWISGFFFQRIVWRFLPEVAHRSRLSFLQDFVRPAWAYKNSVFLLIVHTF